MRTIAAALMACALGACATQPTTTRAHAGTAADAAHAMVAVIETAGLGIRIAAHERSLGTYVPVLLAEAEEDGTAIRDAFDAIQPPVASSDGVRSRLSAILGVAVDQLSRARISARRDAMQQLGSVGLDLRRTSDALRAVEHELG
jgi:hypothetical protein